MYYSHRPKTAKTWDEKEWRAIEYKKLRKHLGMSQREIAELTGLSFNTVRQIPSVDYNRLPSLYVLELMRAEIERRPYFQENAWKETKSLREIDREYHEKFMAQEA